MYPSQTIGKAVINKFGKSFLIPFTTTNTHQNQKNLGTTYESYETNLILPHCPFNAWNNCPKFSLSSHAVSSLAHMITILHRLLNIFQQKSVGVKLIQQTTESTRKSYVRVGKIETIFFWDGKLRTLFWFSLCER